MFISILVTFFTLISLWFIGLMISVRIKNKKTLNFINPFAGIILVLNIVYVLNLSKISISKPFFNLQLLNSVWFLLFILILIFIFSILNSSFKYIKPFKSILFKYLKYSFLAALVISFFFSKLGDQSIARSANELKQLSITHGILKNQNITENIWQTGAGILTALHSEVFRVSTLDSTKILHGITIFLTLYIFIYIIFNFLKLKKPILKALSILLTTGFLFILLNNNFSFSLILGIILFLSILLIEFLKIINKTPNKRFLYIEEFLIAFAIIFLASINSLMFRFSLFIIFIIFLYLLTFKERNKALVFLRPLLLALLINPMIIGFALNF